jgi:hypothetical protein
MHIQHLENRYIKHMKIYVIILLDTKITKKRPSLIEGCNYENYEYDDNDKEYFCHIINKIYSVVENTNEYSNDNGWDTFIYELPGRILDAIEQLAGVSVKDYKIRFNNTYKKMVILIISNGYNRIINIETKKMQIKDKIICLSTNKEIYDELKHLELIINLREFK